jgi:hypothetical protein
VPGDLFADQPGQGPNEFVLRMQPEEELYLKMTIKKPGLVRGSLLTLALLLLLLLPPRASTRGLAHSLSKSSCGCFSAFHTTLNRRGTDALMPNRMDRSRADVADAGFASTSSRRA